jgi:glucose/arabinose dehydrogenase
LFSYSSALAVSTVNDPNLTVTQLVSGLNAPTTMAFIGPGDILVLQKNNGQVRQVLNGVLQGIWT